MNNKAHKLSALEQLQIRKIRLQAEADQCLHSIDKNVEYLQHNFSSILLSSVIAGIKPKLPHFLQGFLPDTTTEKGQNQLRPEGQSKLIKASNVADHVIDILPTVLSGFKPMIIAFLLKKLNKIIFKKK